MQTLDVISVNLWQMLISLANLLVMFFICKRFLYRPVRRILQQRQEEIDTRYAQAALAQKQAEADRAQWESRLGTAREQAQQILEEANRQGAQRRESLIREGKTHQLTNAIASGGDFGMCTMDQSILSRYRAGQITRETALSYAENPEQLCRRLDT